jgi:hypothetical protein
MEILLLLCLYLAKMPGAYSIHIPIFSMFTVSTKMPNILEHSMRPKLSQIEQAE